MQPDLPSNYVTLAQLQQRWMKQKEEEEQEGENQKKLHNKESGPLQVQAYRRNSDRKSNHMNIIGAYVEQPSAVSVEENDREMKMKKEKKERKGQVREPEEVTTGSEPHHALLVKSEKKNAGYERKWDTRMEYRAKVEKMVEENNQTAEIEKKIEDLSVEKESEKSKRQNRVINGRNSYANGGNRNYRSYNDGGDRGNGHYRGGYARFNGNEQRKGRDNGKVWVKKQEVADGGYMVGNQSSSGSLLKGLE
ncbi:hypothetical protein DKX38_002650 [Salix brachista]|uniref:Uncharacterized protein n=1 Tax=Salix brachista TaxID=2182728 RepID=A0A5N5NP91_9ROSI|nr:hypothetical protein DKX38_002650 [Salix brachista]